MKGGNVGIGNTIPNSTLHVSGTLDVEGAAEFDSHADESDIRLKKGIMPLTNALEKVLQLQGVSFYQKNSKENEKQQVGVIAQDVELIYPQVVVTNTQGYKSVRYDRLIAPLIESVKELKAENDALKQRIEALESK